MYLLKISYDVVLIIKLPHIRVISTHTAQEHNGHRNFMNVTVSALRFLTAFAKFIVPEQAQ